MEEQKPSDLITTEMDQEELEEKPPILAPPPAIRCYNSFSAVNIGDDLNGSQYSDSNNLDIDNYYQRYTSVDRYNEDLSIRFLFGNGQPISRISDQHFRAFLNSLNSSRMLPECGYMTSKANMEIRPALEYNRVNGPLSITIEAIRKNDEVFLSISVHCYNENGERQNTVHFEKVILADYEGKVVADRLRRVVDPKKTMSIPICNIVSPNIRMVQLLLETTKFKNKFICFFSYISNIAREVIQIDDFAVCLKVLREYVEAIRKHPEVHAKFRRVKSTGCNPVEVPSLDGPEWLSTLQFLSTCGLLNDTFINIHERWCMPDYLTLSQENVLACLTDFLTVLCHVATKICSSDSCVSQVLHSMSVINHAIENCGIRKIREKMRNIFEKYFTSISTGKIGEFYGISALLDPRFGYSSTIFSPEDWSNVEKKLIKESISDSKSTKRQEQFIKEISLFRQSVLRSRPDADTATPTRWWIEMEEKLPLLFKKWIEYSGPPAVSIDGKRLFAKGGKLAHMYATLDEALHYKGMLLAQSSQDFVGRGCSSLMVFEQIKSVAGSFRRGEKECDTEVQKEVGDAASENEQDEIKEEQTCE